MNRELLRLKKELLKAYKPTKEEQISKALRTIFLDIDEGITEVEAFNILEWDYKSKAELFNVADESKIKVGIFDNAPSTVINFDDSISLPQTKDNIVLNVVGVNVGDIKGSV